MLGVSGTASVSSPTVSASLDGSGVRSGSPAVHAESSSVSAKAELNREVRLLSVRISFTEFLLTWFYPVGPSIRLAVAVPVTVSVLMPIRLTNLVA